MPKKDYYEILGVSRDASDEDIRTAYKKLIKEWHPDRHKVTIRKSQSRSSKRFKRLTGAFRTEKGNVR